MLTIDNFLILARRLNYRISAHTGLILILHNFNLYLGVIWLDDILLRRYLSTIPQEGRGVDKFSFGLEAQGNLRRVVERHIGIVGLVRFLCHPALFRILHTMVGKKVGRFCGKNELRGVIGWRRCRIAGNERCREAESKGFLHAFFKYYYEYA